MHCAVEDEVEERLAKIESDVAHLRSDAAAASVADAREPR
jgi:hypothetical protein